MVSATKQLTKLAATAALKGLRSVMYKMIALLTLHHPKMMLNILQWRLRASTGMKAEFQRSFAGHVLLLALLYKKSPSSLTPLCFPAVSLSHQRRRRRQPQLPPLSQREQMNGRTPGADPSPPKRNLVSLSLPAVRVGAEKPLLLQHLLLARQGE